MAKKSVKVLCMSDLHGSLPDMQEYFGKIDLVVIAGDIFGPNRLASQIDFLTGPFADWVEQLHKSDIEIVGTWGNHDWLGERVYQGKASLISPLDEIFLIDEEKEVCGLRVYGSPWQPRFYNWAFNLDDSPLQLGERFAKIPQGLDILVTHGPPYGILDSVVDGNTVCAGSKELLYALAMVSPPRLHVFGHLHKGGCSSIKIGCTQYVNAAILDDAYIPHERKFIEVTLSHNYKHYLIK